MRDDDPQIETFLRQFKPRPPAPLGLGHRNASPVWWGLAAAAVIAATFWVTRPRRDGPAPTEAVVMREARPRPTLGELSAAWRRGDHEDVLREMDGRMLPDPARPGGALRELGARDRGL
jgi:hypothetical protein